MTAFASGRARAGTAPSRAGASGRALTHARAPVAAAALLAIATALATTSAAAMPLPERTVLSSGVTVLTLPSREAGLASVAVFTRHGGTAYDPRGREGVGLLAHRMMLHGSTRRDAATVAAVLDSLGARRAAESDVELGSITLTATAETFAPSLEVLLECLAEPAFDSLEVERERASLLKEIGAREDRLMMRAFDLAQEAYFGEHPYHAPPLGYAGSVAGLTRESVVEYHRRHFVPSDLVVSVAGEFDAERTLDAIDATFAGLEAAAERPPGLESAAPPAPAERTEKRRSQATWMVAAFPAPPQGSPDEAPFAVLRAVLGGSMGSRLFHELRDKRSLAYEVGGVYRAGVHGSFLAAYIGTREPFETARDALVGEVRRTLVDPASAVEVSDARSMVRGHHLLRLERNEERARFYGAAESLGLGVEYGNAFLAAVAAVTPDDVQRVAERYLTGAVVAAVVPEGSGS